MGELDVEEGHHQRNPALMLVREKVFSDITNDMVALTGARGNQLWHRTFFTFFLPLRQHLVDLFMSQKYQIPDII